ncbi:hypothetical protein GUITHDRAFT_154679 [Guillardia theta CCMP2712]|uniref:Uncharacterized protein n=1 Tax=Guillardia theta (strain CCMP2712) TaxID=905079 RepID=L1IQZ3_GUITC|nr:hypothetical protein GUITHDRAFT_154679 [Guillardia theta CCMP2712]EKX38512.1 hypothetical protein GUITHDRAFT_154679 [Guillardia theta CCMP2712]|eukprot:XP_005825492.1 hypothetical protein GUITHDRAFT_154679 [Guillardia theta CCMP2712]
MVWLNSDAGSMGIGVLGARIAVDNVSRRAVNASSSVLRRFGLSSSLSLSSAETPASVSIDP